MQIFLKKTLIAGKKKEVRTITVQTVARDFKLSLIFIINELYIKYIFAIK